MPPRLVLFSPAKTPRSQPRRHGQHWSGDWLSLVRAVLYPEALGEPAPAALHLAVAGFAASRRMGDVELFTLNFDLLLERALESAAAELGMTVGVHARRSAVDRAVRDAFEVHHLHGCLGQEPRPPESIVLTLSDFNAVSAQPSPWQRSALQEAASRGPLLLAGTSYRDADMRQWLHDLGLGASGTAAIVLLSRQGLGLDRVQFDRVRDALIAQWTPLGIEPVLLHGHSDAAQAVRELNAMSGPEYRAPRDRAVALWTQLSDEFDERQPEHAELLADDVDDLRAVLGADSHVTLWVADGTGNLVRWASGDRQYRRVDDLRRVPAGFDSPWIAGQSLGRDDVMARDLGRNNSASRWRSLVAVPVVVDLPGGPPVTTAVLTSAARDELNALDTDSWVDAAADLADRWASRLGGGIARNIATEGVPSGSGEES